MPKGLTLIEILIYVSILTIILILVVNTTILLSDLFGKARLKKNVINQAQAAMERITREINLAESLNDAESILGSHPGKINLNTFTSPSDPAPTTREFFLNGSNLVIKEGSDPEKIITSGIEITNLVFYKITAPSISEGIKIELTAGKTAGKFNYSAKFTNTAILKGSY